MLNFREYKKIIFVFFTMTSLNLFANQEEKSQNNLESPLSLYNQAVLEISNNQIQKAFPLLQKSFYQHLFVPSYFVLKKYENAPYLGPFLWHILMLFFTLLSFLLSYFILLKKGLTISFKLKGITFWFFSLTILSLSGFFILKTRISNTASLGLKENPLEDSETVLQIQKGSDLVLIDRHGDWLKIKTKGKKIGWINFENIIFTLKK